MVMNALEVKNLSKSFGDFALQDVSFTIPMGTALGLVGENGAIWGLNSFGFSAPYKVLDEKLGFTAQNVYDQVKKLL